MTAGSLRTRGRTPGSSKCWTGRFRFWPAPPRRRGSLAVTRLARVRLGAALDFSAVDNVDGVSTAGIRQLAEGNPWPRFSVRACIVTTDEQFGLVRMYQALGEPKTDHVGITRSAADADAFIARERVRLGIAI